MPLSRRLMLSAMPPLATGLLPTAARTQADAAFPDRPLRLVVPFPPGGSADLLARLLQPRLGEIFGQAPVVENRPGGATVIGTDAAVKSPADGHTLLFVANSFTINATLVRNAPFDARRDFTGVASIGFNPHVLVASPTLPVPTVAELVERARTAPGWLNYASFGNGTSSHLGGASFARAAGLEMVHVPYRGAAPALQDVAGGTVPLMFANLPEALPLIRDSKVKALALADEARAPALPDTPTFDEAGVRGVVSNSWFGFVARSGTPPAMLDTLNVAFNCVLGESAMAARFAQMGVSPRPMGLAAFAELLRSEFDRNARLIRDAGIALD